MGCRSSKVGQVPSVEDKPGSVTEITATKADAKGESIASAEESRPAQPISIVHTTDSPKGSDLDFSHQNGEGEAAGGETMVDESGLVMRTPRRPSQHSLHAAAKSGDLLLVKDLLSMTCSASRPGTVDSTLDEGRGPTGSTALPGNPSGVDIDEMGMWGNTPLLVATQYGNAEIALALVENGADVRALNERGATPLLYACVEGTSDVALALLDKGADVDPPVAAVHHSGVQGGRTVKLTPLISAAVAGHIDIVRMLMDSGAMVDRKIVGNPITSCGSKGLGREGESSGDACCEDGVTEGMSALTAAARYGHTETVLLLVDNGANLLARENGRTALTQAIEGGHDETAQALLDAARSLGKARRLVETGAASPGGHRPCAGPSPLHLASAKGLIAVVKALLSAGAVVDRRDGDGETPLFYACRKGCVACARELLSRGADPSTASNNGSTPLEVVEHAADKEWFAELHGLLEKAAVTFRRPDPPGSIESNNHVSDVDRRPGARDPDVDGAEQTEPTQNGEDDEENDVLLVTDWDKQFDGDDDPNVMLFDANGGGDGMNVSSPQPGQRPPSSERNPRSATEQGAVPDKESGVLPLQAVLPVEGNVGEDEDVLMLGDYNVDEDLEGFVVDGVASAAESGAWETTNERPRSGVKLELSELLGDTPDIEGHLTAPHGEQLQQQQQQQQHEPETRSPSNTPSSSVIVDTGGASVSVADVASHSQSCEDTIEDAEMVPMMSAPHSISLVAEESVDRTVTAAAVENTETRQEACGEQDPGSEQDELLPEGQ